MATIRGKAEISADLAATKIDRYSSVAEQAIKWGALTAIAYFAYLTVAALAGKQTFADVGIRFLANVRVSEAVAWIFGAGGVGYGLQQKKLRRNASGKMAERISELEARIDPSRSSSTLPKSGKTRPEDKR